nr:cation-translocating P-type ATPase [Faecalibacillus faecis]
MGIFEENDLCLEGQKLDLLNNYELDETLPRVSVYARVAPEHKIRIVEAWQRKGKVVAMTGDGVNDAPALKQSDIGVAMGITGSEVAKDAANMILTNDNFSTIVHAIIIGRNVYEHLKNLIYYLLSGNFAGILCVLLASLFILPTPFYPAHLLFMNLITDSLPAIAIGMEKNDQDVLKYPPRKKDESLLNKKALFRISFEGIVIGLCTMVSYYCGLKINTLAASTFAFATICLSRLLHGLSNRNEKTID